MEPGLVDILGHKAVLEILMEQNFDEHYLGSSSVLRLNASSVLLKLWSLYLNPAPNFSTRWWINDPRVSAVRERDHTRLTTRPFHDNLIVQAIVHDSVH